MMHPVVVVPEEPELADRGAILVALSGYNVSTGGPYRYAPVAVLVRDQDSDETVGGFWGQCLYDWLFVELLFVPESLRGRGLGTELMKTAERLARERACVGIWLDTFSFQAPEFYRSLGYEVFGQLPDHPRGATRYFMRKLLV